MAQRRPLHDNEEKFVKYVFGTTIFLGNVEVVARSGGFGGFTPLGCVNMDSDHFRDDYIGPNMYTPFLTPVVVPGDDQFYHAHHFLHELGHVWQHFVGMPMLAARLGATSAARRKVRADAQPKVVGGLRMRPTYMFNATYNYHPTQHTDLSDYNMEQQCEIIADYFAQTMWGRAIPANGSGFPIATQGQLEQILDNFLEDRSYVMRDRVLWRGRARRRGRDRR
jgi:hypothetical protein